MSRLKVGMIGLDTSHCPSFAELLHNEANPFYIDGARITVAFPGGSAAFANSYNRIDRFTAEMRDKYGVAILDSIAAVAEQVDAIMLESVDGRQHLEQFRVLAPFGKPVFIDKPLATSTNDVLAMMKLSEKYNAPIYSCSPLRYASGLQELGSGQQILGCQVYGPMGILPDFPGYFWYGIHSAEVLYAKMGRGCRSVSVRHTETTDAVIGVWDDGRIGTLYGYRHKGLNKYGATVFTPNEVLQATASSTPPYYANMLPLVLEFFRTRKAPLDIKESLEITAFLEAANKARATGEDVPLAVC